MFVILFSMFGADSSQCRQSDGRHDRNAGRKRYLRRAASVGGGEGVGTVCAVERAAAAGQGTGDNGEAEEGVREQGQKGRGAGARLSVSRELRTAFVNRQLSSYRRVGFGNEEL